MLVDCYFFAVIDCSLHCCQCCCHCCSWFYCHNWFFIDSYVYFNLLLHCGHHNKRKKNIFEKWQLTSWVCDVAEWSACWIARCKKEGRKSETIRWLCVVAHWLKWLKTKQAAALLTAVWVVSAITSKVAMWRRKMLITLAEFESKNYCEKLQRFCHVPQLHYFL